MDDVIDDLQTIAKRCERTRKAFKSEPLHSTIDLFDKVSTEVGKSWSQSWLGYHASVYLEGFRKPRSSEKFDAMWGDLDYGNTNGPWKVYSYDEVLDEIRHRASSVDTELIEAATYEAREAFRQNKSDILPLLDALIENFGDRALQKIRNEIESLVDHFDQTNYVQMLAPKQYSSRDMNAFHEGPKVPHHIAFQAWLFCEASFGTHAGQLAEKVRHVQRYLEAKHKMKGKSIARTQGKIAIGHGRSSEWLVLKSHLQDEFQLEVDEFNQQSVAGISNKDRLEQMLDDAWFAFLVLTAEDEHTDGSQHARENVVHEVGLFQGRLGFKRAIVLLEDQCKEFSNIQGLGQIRFKKGEMSAKFYEIRKVLEREGIIK